MPTIHKEILIDAAPERVWDAVRDWAAPHTRLVPGFVTDTRLDGPDRLVTFFTGDAARERLIALDDERRRLVWSVLEGPFSHDNAAAQVHEAGDGRARFTWTHDFLPDEPELVERIDALMERGTQTIRQTMEAR